MLSESFCEWNTAFSLGMPRVMLRRISFSLHISSRVLHDGYLSILRQRKFAFFALQSFRIHVYLMPREPSFHHPLRDLRVTLGKEYTQKKFARELGVSEVAIKRIENGTLRLSTQMKARIAGCTGVDAESLDSGKFTISGRPFSSSAFFLFRLSTRTREMGEDKAQLHAYEVNAQLQAIEQMKALTNAAADKNKFHVFLFLWHEWLYRTIEDFDLRYGFFECATMQGVPADTLGIWGQLLKKRRRTRSRKAPVRRRRIGRRG